MPLEESKYFELRNFLMNHRVDNFQDNYTCTDPSHWGHLPIIQEPVVLKEFFKLSGIIGSTVQSVAFSDIPHIGHFFTKLERNSAGEIIQEKLSVFSPIVFCTDQGRIPMDMPTIGSFIVGVGDFEDVLLNPEPSPDACYLRLDRWFEPILGHRIIAIDIGDCPRPILESEWVDNGNIVMNKSPDSYICSVVLQFDNDFRVLFSTEYDWCNVELIHQQQLPVSHYRLDSEFLNSGRDYKELY